IVHKMTHRSVRCPTLALAPWMATAGDRRAVAAASRAEFAKLEAAAAAFRRVDHDTAISLRGDRALLQRPLTPLREHGGLSDRQVVKRLPDVGDEKQYIIKSALEPCGRVAKESELERA